MPKESQTDIKFMMMAAQKPIKLTVLKMVPLNVATFASVNNLI